VFAAALAADGGRLVFVRPALDPVSVCRDLALARCIVVSGHGYTSQFDFTIHKYAVAPLSGGKFRDEIGLLTRVWRRIRPPVFIYLNGLADHEGTTTRSAQSLRQVEGTGYVEETIGDVVAFLPGLVGALVVLLIGWVVGVAVARVVSRLTDAVELDRMVLDTPSGRS
jgi:hypothetical protein